MWGGLIRGGLAAVWLFPGEGERYIERGEEGGVGGEGGEVQGGEDGPEGRVRNVKGLLGGHILQIDFVYD